MRGSSGRNTWDDPVPTTPITGTNAEAGTDADAEACTDADAEPTPRTRTALPTRAGGLRTLAKPSTVVATTIARNTTDTQSTKIRLRNAMYPIIRAALTEGYRGAITTPPEPGPAPLRHGGGGPWPLMSEAPSARLRAPHRAVSVTREGVWSAWLMGLGRFGLFRQFTVWALPARVDAVVLAAAVGHALPRP